MDTEQFEGRKRDHIRHAMDPAHQATGLSGLAGIRLRHEALPDLDLEDIRLDSECLGSPARTPFYVAGMTAGHADAPALNRTLAQACAERGWAMGVGSQRRELEASSQGPKSAEIDQWKRLRQEVPNLVIFANLGISQLIHSKIEDVRRVVESIGAQALAVHLNPLQEALQPEGTPRFKGAFQAFDRVCRELGLPVILKETGCGFSPSTLARLREIPLAAIDVSGLGGTHWGRIEGARALEGSPQQLAARTFAGWGESTVDSVVAAREVFGDARELWASGGVRTGLDAAKLIALGAERVGYAQPALEAALAGPDKLRLWMETQEYELKVALFCTGSATPGELRSNKNAVEPGAGR